MDRAPPTVIDFTAEHLEMFIVLRTANDTEDKFKKPQHKHRKLAKDGTSFEIIGDEKCDWDDPIPSPGTDSKTICLGVCNLNGDGFPSYKIHGT
jgi:hypothetical protein